MPVQRHEAQREDALVGTVIAGFRILSAAGRDAAGSASYRVVEAGTEDAGVLRLVPAGRDPELASRFLAQARLLGGLDHPSLPSVLAVGEAPEGAYVVTEGPPGRSLAVVLDGRRAPRQALQMLADVAAALDVVHAAGLLHGALRPANILVGEWLMVRPVLSNFGLGRASGEAMDDEQAPYASPEELRGETPGPPADRYALACTLFEVLTGAPPFGRSRDAAVHGHSSEPPPRVTELRPGFEPALDAVIHKALAKDPGARYGSSREMVSDVARMLSRVIAPGIAREAAPALLTEAVPAPATSEPAPEASATLGAPPEPVVIAELEPIGEPVPVELQPEPEPLPTARARPRSERKSGGVGDLAWTTIPVGASLAVIALAAAGGLLLSRLTEADEPAARTATQGPLSLRVPEGWKRTNEVPRLGELKLERPIALASGSGDGMLTGISSREGAVLNPGLLADDVAEVRSAPAAVRLGPLDAYRWSGLRVRNSRRRADLYVAPTSRVALTVACYGAQSAGACARAANSVRLMSSRGHSPLRAARWREGLRIQMRRLKTRLAGGRQRLDAAADPDAQARGASSIAAAHRAAAQAVAADPAPPQADEAKRQVVAALKGLQRGYRALAQAARAGDSAAFEAAGEAIERQDSRLRSVLRMI